MNIHKSINIYKYETHFHTCEASPCGKVKAAEAVRLYRSMGYAGIIVTDHYTRDFFEGMHPYGSWSGKVGHFLSGFRNAREEGLKTGIDVHLGMEIRFDENANDYLVYGFDEEFLIKNKELYSLTLREFRELASGMDIAVVQAHPFRPGMVPAPPQLLDGVEVWNGNPRHDSFNHLAYEYAVENGLRMLSGSDFHMTEDAAAGGIAMNRMIGPGEFARLFLNNVPMTLICPGHDFVQA